MSQNEIEAIINQLYEVKADTTEIAMQDYDALGAKIHAVNAKIDTVINLLYDTQALTVPASQPAQEAGRFKLDVFLTGRHIAIEYAQENPYKGQLFPSVEAAIKAITRDYGEHEAQAAADALNAGSQEAEG
jgi:hypothetical protein